MKSRGIGIAPTAYVEVAVLKELGKDPVAIVQKHRYNQQYGNIADDDCH